MQPSHYNHPAAPARAIPLGEEPLVTRAKVCAQLRAAIQVLEEGSWDARTIGQAKTHLQGSMRVLFVAQGEIRRETIQVRREIGQMGQEKRP